MTGPAALNITLAALMLTIAVYCAGRVVAGRLLRRCAGRDADLSHTAMGVAMAGMLVPRLNPLPVMAWETLFAAGTAWFGFRACQDRVRILTAQHTPHLVHNAAMVYMFVTLGQAAVPQPAAVDGMSGSATIPALGLALALVMLGYAIIDLDRLAPATADRLPVLAPRLARLCRIGLGVTMSYAVIVML